MELRLRSAGPEELSILELYQDLHPTAQPLARTPDSGEREAKATFRQADFSGTGKPPMQMRCHNPLKDVKEYEHHKN
jgi:hypothetical protein